MTPITVEGKKLWIVKSLSNFECAQCALHTEKGKCVRVKRVTGELYFEIGPNDEGILYCINQQHDIVFIKNTPKQIAKYVAARLEST